MPQTIIYVASRTAGPAGYPEAVATEGLARLFGRSAALAGIGLHVQAGRTVALLGPNGAGKTTLLRILATALRPSFGSLFIDGLDALRDADLVRGRVAYLPHATGLYDDLTAAENLRFAVRLHGRRGAEVDERVALLLAEVELGYAADQRTVTLSAGMRRRLALARLLAGAPSLVLLDEPHATLDADGMALVDRLLGLWHAAGVTVVVASHQADRVTAMADATVRLEGGLVAEVSGSGVFAAPAPTAGLPLPSLAGADR
ncbi:MAG TPA: heme ABC exporter ATP-binding protein CcmA [Candidatus Limnocylindria bacterium]|nr:heme ABC exporter ATP-binding protein CcmA [Candidatus Limnocylindria bacterium]